MNIIRLTLLTLCIAANSSARFNETWAYLMKGEEKYFPVTSPITDIGCFSASVDPDGNLTGGHQTPPRLSGANPGTRYHLVITMPWSTTLSHLYLDPELPFRQRIIDGITERCQPFDGLQIDFEAISSKDRANYFKFLVAVKKALPEDKLFSVAVMARWADHKKKNPQDAFDYSFIGKVADRVIVMAYDEHYRGGSAGPIASLPWCTRIYNYASSTIPGEKLIMGIPLYGRSWQKEKTTAAMRNPEVWTDLRKRGVELTSTSENGGSYSYSTNVTINVHFESMPSLNAKMDLYASRPTQGIAFWRISQEPLGFWNKIAE
ncbi:glycosyl hydrolase family 18 protein [Pontiella agarivorans]|uniref:Glycosyl hydrolase family 18 protein n=1 Tax=Pontiella agarivorans TaxID=3038953 RepID=A0ABU5N0I7_9BACT|nr:glycosyl hydrolase family 18 protein [Pontiella agarivorans]MDZ8119933.1 glycosyl hydrolase family 18 protein [Pontiella agarivorans]